MLTGTVGAMDLQLLCCNIMKTKTIKQSYSGEHDLNAQGGVRMTHT